MKKLFVIITIGVSLFTLSNSYVQSQNRCYIKLFQHDTYKGASKTIFLDNCAGTINIYKSSQIHDAISSLILAATTNVTIELCQHHTTDNNFPGNTYIIKGTIKGKGTELHINKGMLIQHGVHDNISCIRIYIDGKLVPGEIWVQ